VISLKSECTKSIFETGKTLKFSLLGKYIKKTKENKKTTGLVFFYIKKPGFFQPWQQDPSLGWDAKTAGSLTVGELYWMLGEEEGGARVQLDYTWRRDQQQEQPCQVSRSVVGTYLVKNTCRRRIVLKLKV